VRIFGEEVRVRASIHTIGGLSAHADQAALLSWLKRFETAPQRSFVVHGEARTACGFADRIAEELGWSVEAPAPGTRVDL
jgi:metallo-beta-lactamase family protein